MASRVLTGLTYLPWLALLGWLSSVAWFLCDDAFISFRYVRNLVEGNGLVFNPGEYVEGYTNFLWVLELAAIWAIFGVLPYEVAPWLSVGYTVATIAAMLWWVARLASLGKRRLVGWMALGLVCSSATVAVWTSAGGLETRQFTFFIVAAVVLLTSHGKRSWGLAAASLSLAGAELTRPEGLLLAGCCFGWYAVQRLVSERKMSAVVVREMILLVAPFAALVAAHYLFRYAYYGEWLPNTYYAKHIRPWYESGFRYVWSGTLETGLYMLLPLAYVALRSRWRENGDSSFALALLCVVVHMAYLMPIGGDHFEYRPFDFYWPLLALPAATGLVHLGSRVSEAAGRLRQVRQGMNRPEVYAIVLFLPVLFYANSIQGVLLFKNAAIDEYIHKMHTELNEEEEAWLLAAPGMPAIVAVSNDLRKRSVKHLVGLRFSEHRELAALVMRHWKPYEGMERGIIPDGAVMAASGIGKFYFLPDLDVVDTDGLTDATIARTPVMHPNTERLIAHDRNPTPEYLERRGVNIWVDPPAASESEARKHAVYTAQVGPDLWLPFTTNDPQLVLDFLPQTTPESKLTWTFFQPHRERAIDFDVGISLLDASFETQQQPLFAMLTWKVAPGLDADYRISLHLYNVDGEEAWEQDYSLVAMFMGAMRPTGLWWSDVPTKTLSLLEVPPDLSPGQYELRLFVYDSQTFTPAVELEGGEPETVLAQVQVQ